MNHIDDLKESTRKLLKDSLAEDDLTITSDTGDLIFLTHVFENGNVMGFWTHSPCGNTRDQEQGNMVLSPSGKTIDYVPTREYGQTPVGHEPFKEWRQRMKEDNGKAIKLSHGADGVLIWRKQDC